jgi:hypothetical protein
MPEFKIDISSYLENDNLKINTIQFQKMVLLFNAIEDGWTLKKRDNAYVFTKNHEGKKEILHDDYLQQFMKQKLDMTHLS